MPGSNPRSRVTLAMDCSMTTPADQGFDTVSGTLGSGSATIDGVTYFNTDPTAVLSVSGGMLSLGGSTLAQTVAGFKTADGSDFKLNALDLYNAGVYALDFYRDGVPVGTFTFPIAGPATLTFAGFENVDELRLTRGDSGAIVIDTLDFSAAIPTHLAPTINGLGGNTVTYTEGAPPVFIDAGQDAIIDDPDTFFFTGGSLTVAISVNIDPSEDVLGIQTGSGVSLSAPLANGVTVFVGATAIGTVTSDGSNGHELQIAFNGNATAASASELLHAITYQDTN